MKKRMRFSVLPYGAVVATIFIWEQLGFYQNVMPYGYWLAAVPFALFFSWLCGHIQPLAKSNRIVQQMFLSASILSIVQIADALCGFQAAYTNGQSLFLVALVTVATVWFAFCYGHGKSDLLAAIVLFLLLFFVAGGLWQNGSLERLQYFSAEQQGRHLLPVTLMLLPEYFAGRAGEQKEGRLALLPLFYALLSGFLLWGQQAVLGVLFQQAEYGFADAANCMGFSVFSRIDGILYYLLLLLALLRMVALTLKIKPLLRSAGDGLVAAMSVLLALAFFIGERRWLLFAAIQLLLWLTALFAPKGKEA